MHRTIYRYRLIGLSIYFSIIIDKTRELTLKIKYINRIHRTIYTYIIDLIDRRPHRLPIYSNIIIDKTGLD